jgi:uncharacterized protein YbjQ (UPF0145 family)
MAPRNPYFWGLAEDQRIAGGALPRAAETRLKELSASGRFTSFLSPRALAATADAHIEPLGQVVGFSSGLMRVGILRTTRPGQGRPRPWTPRWRERSGPVESWDTVRKHARRRLAEQAKLVGANAVVGVSARRDEHGSIDVRREIELELAGTAVRLPAKWRERDAEPLLTLASAQELWALLRAGIEPVGIVGSYAAVETSPGLATASASIGTANAELPDLTRAVYEARHLAMGRLGADARGMEASGVIGVDLHDRHERGSGRLPALHVEVHLLGTAVRRRRPGRIEPDPIVRVGGVRRG